MELAKKVDPEEQGFQILDDGCKDNNKAKKSAAATLWQRLDNWMWLGAHR
jgi:hypothetical protein